MTKWRIGQPVLVKWSDGLPYPAVVLKVHSSSQTCLIKFGEEDEHGQDVAMSTLQPDDARDPEVMIELATLSQLMNTIFTFIVDLVGHE